MGSQSGEITCADKFTEANNFARSGVSVSVGLGKGVSVGVAVEVGVASGVDVAPGGVPVLTGAVTEAGREVKVSITAGRLGVARVGIAWGRLQAV